MEKLSQKLEEISGQYPAAVSREERVAEVKQALREFLQEWLDDKFRVVGRWSARGFAAAAVTAFIYFWLIHTGWVHK